MIINERDSRHQSVLDAARLMMTAARTAPKGKGLDLIETAIVEGDDLLRLSDAMMRLHQMTGRHVFERDAANILQAEAVMIIGVRRQSLGLDCGHCGFATCAEKPEKTPCVFNSVDVGIAIGSACSLGADLRIDSRVMYSAGMAAMQLRLLPECCNVFAIALSASSKNPFFDR